MTSQDGTAVKAEQREFWRKAATEWRLADERIRATMAPMTDLKLANGCGVNAPVKLAGYAVAAVGTK